MRVRLPPRALGPIRADGARALDLTPSYTAARPSRIVLFGAPGDTGRLTAQAFVREVFERFDALEQGSREAGLARV